MILTLMLSRIGLFMEIQTDYIVEGFTQNSYFERGSFACERYAICCERDSEALRENGISLSQLCVPF